MRMAAVEKAMRARVENEMVTAIVAPGDEIAAIRQHPGWPRAGWTTREARRPAEDPAEIRTGCGRKEGWVLEKFRRRAERCGRISRRRSAKPEQLPRVVVANVGEASTCICNRSEEGGLRAERRLERGRSGIARQASDLKREQIKIRRIVVVMA